MKDFAKSIRTGNAYIKKNTDGTSEITKGWFSGTKIDDSNKNTILKKAEDMARIEKETEIEIEKIQKEYDESKGVTFYDGEYIGTDAIGGLVVKKGHLAGKYTRGAFQGRLNTQKKYNKQNKREWNGLLEELKKVGNSKACNSYTRGQKIGTDGKNEYLINSVMEDGTIIVSRHPDGRTWTFSSEQEVKDWLRNSKIGNSRVGNEYKPDIRITPADLSRKLKQAKNISEIDDIDDEIEYDLREYENAIDECKLKIKDYERSMSALRMIQRDVSDARRNLK